MNIKLLSPTKQEPLAKERSESNPMLMALAREVGIVEAQYENDEAKSKKLRLLTIPARGIKPRFSASLSGKPEILATKLNGNVSPR